jgi:hypothetical protein
VVWVRWAPHPFSGWYVGPGLSLWCFRLLFLFSRMELPKQYRGNDHFLNTSSSSLREVMVDGALTRVSTLRVGLGVGGATIASGSCARPSHSCDGWVGDLGVVGVSSIFGLVRGSGTFVAALPTFVLVSRM